MNSENPSNKNLIFKNETPTFKLYKKRWFILFLYILYAAINAFQWFEYSIITNVVMKFYKTSAVAVDWTSIIYMALYMPMVIPASYLMEKLDLRKIVLIGVTGTAFGTSLKFFSLDRNNLWVVYLSQTVLSSMQVFILALPPRIASVWFGPKEVSLACALGVFGTQLGQALGFLLPPIIIKNHENLLKIRQEFSILTYSLTGTILTVTGVIFVSRPLIPPHRRVCNKEDGSDFLISLKKLLQCKNLNFLAVAYGINIGVFVSVSTLLNQFMLSHFDNSEEDAGRIGLLMIVLGMLGAIVCGFILDKTHTYKLVTSILYIFSFISFAIFTFALKYQSMVLVYISGSLVGLFINSYMVVGLELSVELTYPEPESTSSGLLISMTQTMGVLFTLLLGWLFAKVGCFWALASMGIFLLFGVVLTLMIENATKRQDVLKH